MNTPPTASEIQRLMRLALPVIISQVGNMLMGLADTLIVGRYSSTELAGVAIGNSIFWTVAMIGLGFLSGMDPIVSQAHGADDNSNTWRCLGAALQSSIIFTVLISPFLLIIAHYLALAGTTPDVAKAAQPFLFTLTFCLLPLMLFISIQRYWQSLEIVVPFTIIILLSNVLNYFLADTFVNGRYGFASMGAEGAAWATFIVRLVCLLCAAIVSFYLWHKHPKLRPAHSSFRQLIIKFDRGMHKRLFKLGFPGATQMGLEVCAFSLTTLLIARLGAQIIATHQIVLNIASFAFMFPLGLSAATATRVGYHVGQENLRLALKTGWLGIYLSIAIMSCSACILFIWPEYLLSLFSQDQDVIKLGLSIIFLCALFQIFDGIQIVSAGALRGLGDTKTALYSNLVAHWCLGLPAGLSLCFWYNLGLLGLWIGLALGLFFTAILNTYEIHRRRIL